MELCKKTVIYHRTETENKKSILFKQTWQENNNTLDDWP